MKYWSLLFGLAAVAVVAVYAYAPFDPGWWLPGYRATNAASLAAFDALDIGADRATDTLIALGQAEQADPAAFGPRLDAHRDRLERQSARLERIADRHYLTNRTREIQGLVATASESLGTVRSDLGSGDDAALPGAIEAATADLERLDLAVNEALAEVGGVDGPDRAPLSTAGAQVDHLYIFILVVTGLTFVGTMGVLVYSAWRFAADPSRRATYTHGSQRLEVVWTIIPAAILVFIALYQIGAWADIKFRNTWPDVKPLARVTARQFQWKIRYPGPDGKLNTGDDLHTVNDLHFVKDKPTIIHLTSEDVLHSFFLPQLRIKQDAVPGLTIPVKFDANKAGHYELLCAELCGWGHYKMRANVTVHETQSEFDEWMGRALREQNRSEAPGTGPDPPAGADVASAAVDGPRVE